jgi:putative phosphoesterase
MVKVGLISDTHGLLRPEALAALAGVDRIIHGGDIGKPEILDALRAIAPLIVVRGNNDRAGWAAEIPESTELAVEGVRIHALHDVKLLAIDPAAAGMQVVVSGHSHRPSMARRAGVLFVNPGSAGPRRFSLPVSVALLDIDGASVQARIVELTLAAR